MEKKIGILTFHNCVNYGAAMQTYGLQSFLVSKGYNVEIIDYVNEKINSELNARIDVSFGVKSVVRYVAKNLHRARKRGQFNAFNNSYLNLSKQKNITINQMHNYSTTYDVLITGSDQVWNLNLTGDDKTYYLDFASQETCKISYAASVGDISKVDISPVLKEIKNMDFISVREKSFLDFISQEHGIDAALCCDPTILCDKKCFYNISDYRLSKHKYIFIFLMEDKPEIVAFANELAKRNGNKVINNKTSFEFFAHSKPTDFLSWIRHAEVILTDSFHGTVFSVIFKKQFLSDKYDGKKHVKSRVNDLLIEFGLEECFQDISFENRNQLEDIISTPIDYEKIERNVKHFSTKSEQWLLEALKGK